MRIQFSTIVNRPIERVFGLVGNPQVWPQFETDFLEIRPLTTGAERAGTTYRFKRKMPGKIAEGQFSLTEYVPNKAIMMQCDWVGPLKPSGGYRLAQVPEGTRVDMIEQVELRGALRFLAPLMRLAFKQMGNATLRNLKRLAEA
jgi:hypothetical protein